MFFGSLMALIITVLITLPLISCVDTSGDEKDTDKLPDRIISLAPSNTEILYALNLDDKVVGVTEYCDYPPSAQEKEKIGGFSTVDMERVIELEPDLVLASGMHSETIVPELEERGLNVVVVDPKTVDEVTNMIALIGTLTDCQEEADNLVAEMESRIQSITDETGSLTSDRKPRVFYITWHDPIWTVGRGTITNELMEKAGGKNIFSDCEEHLETSMEAILDRNPDIILASTGHGSAEDSPVSWAQTEDRLREINARKSGRIYKIDSDLVTRAGPRIVDGLETLARLIHPDIFTEPGDSP